MVCLLELLYATGLRVSELVALPRAAGATRERYLFIKGKGGRERLVPLTEAARAALAQLRAAKFAHHPPTGPTPHDGMRPRIRTYRRTRMPGSKIGSISQATKVAQAIRDARH